MTERDYTALLAAATAGRLSRRQVLSAGLKLGLATPLITSLIAAAGPGTAAAAPATVPQAAQDNGSGTFTVVITTGFSDLDPQNAYDNNCSMFFLGVYEMLVMYKGESTEDLVGVLAESWSANDDLTEFTFNLAPGATFHDGTPADAAAVKYSFTRFLEMGGGPVNVISRFVEDPDLIEVIDPVTVKFTMTRPEPLFLPAMASEYGPFVVNPILIEANKSADDPFASQWLQMNFAGSGPYTVTEYLPNERMILDRFADYHMGWEGNQFNQVVIRTVPEISTRRQLLESGDIDALTVPSLTPTDIASLQANPDLNVVLYPTTAINWTMFNVPRLLTPEVRRGFCYAFPYKEVVDGAYKGLIERISGPIAKSVLGYDPDGFIYPTDMAMAKELIATGFPEGSRFEYMVPAADENGKLTAQIFQAKMAEIGYTLEIQEVDSATISQLVYGDVPVEEKPHLIGGRGWWPDYNDPWNQLAPNFLESEIGGGANGGGYVNERFEAIMAEAEAFETDEQLIALMKEANQILTEIDPPAIFVGQTTWYTVLQSDIQGYIPNPLYMGSYPFMQMSRGES